MTCCAPAPLLASFDGDHAAEARCIMRDARCLPYGCHTAGAPSCSKSECSHSPMAGSSWSSKEHDFCYQDPGARCRMSQVEHMEIPMGTSDVEVPSFDAWFYRPRTIGASSLTREEERWRWAWKERQSHIVNEVSPACQSFRIESLE